MYPKRSKYKARKVEVDGIVFDSKKESRRWQELQAMQDAGIIFDLVRQQKFVVIPAAYEPDVIGPRGGVRKGKLIERECSYIADFVYRDIGGKMIVEDTKGVRTPDYIIKRKLMLFRYGIRIKEV